MIRLAVKKDLDQVMKVIMDAKKQLREMNLLQWNVSEYPDETTMEIDINKEELYVYEENQIIKACAVIKKFDDGYGNYNFWETKENYYSIHRFAVHSDYTGNKLGVKLLEYAEKLAKSMNFDIRIDTHKDNYKMCSLLNKCNYKFVGVVEVNTPSDRLRDAFEKKL